MGIEIERKFLVEGDSWMNESSREVVCKQGYLLSDDQRTVRVRIMGDQSYLTVKGSTSGFTRSEFEYAIPVEDADAMLELCGNIVEKIRHYITHAGMVWELDVFSGANEGLIMAEIELESEVQMFEIPPWAGCEVTGDVRYYNGYLAHNPFSTW